MKITKTEKIIVGMICLMCLVLLASLSSCVLLINKAGGIDNVIIETGKDIKNIATKIKED